MSSTHPSIWELQTLQRSRLQIRLVLYLSSSSRQSIVGGEVLLISREDVKTDCRISDLKERLHTLLLPLAIKIKWNGIYFRSQFTVWWIPEQFPFGVTFSTRTASSPHIHLIFLTAIRLFMEVSNKLAVSLQSSENVLKLFNMITRTQCQICQLWIFKKVWQYHLLIFSQCKSRLTGIYLMSNIQLCYSNQKSHIRCIHRETRQMVTEIYNYFPIEMQIPLNNSGKFDSEEGRRQKRRIKTNWTPLMRSSSEIIMSVRTIGLQLIFVDMFFLPKKSQFVFSCQFLLSTLSQ